MSSFNGDIFCERANQLFSKSKQGQKELAANLSVSQSVISDIINKNVKAPRADTIFSIANYFNVSTDWLLGLTDVQTTDKATKELCDTLGLSENAIVTLRESNDTNKCINYLFYQDAKTKELAKEDDIEDNINGSQFECETLFTHSYLEILSRFFELSEKSYFYNTYFKAKSDGSIEVGKIRTDENEQGCILGIEFENSKDNGELLSSDSIQMQSLLNRMVAQMQVLIDDKILFEYDGEGEE